MAEQEQALYNRVRDVCEETGAFLSEATLAKVQELVDDVLEDLRATNQADTAIARQRLAEQPEWVVVRSDVHPPRLECQRCRAWEVIGLPLRVDEFLVRGSLFIRKHVWCPEASGE